MQIRVKPKILDGWLVQLSLHNEAKITILHEIRAKSHSIPAPKTNKLNRKTKNSLALTIFALVNRSIGSTFWFGLAKPKPFGP
jgi:hypothetical protein